MNLKDFVSVGGNLSVSVKLDELRQWHDELVASSGMKKPNEKLSVQGISFTKGDYSFKGSEIDRQFSYSKIDYQLKQNSRKQEQTVHQSFKPEHSQNQSFILENIGSAVGGLFDIQPFDSDYDPNEAELMRQQKPKKKEKRKGVRM